jgi:alcohol dehydrogenase
MFRSFDHQPRTRIVFGNGEIHRLGEIALDLKARRALLVTDPGIVAAGHTQRAIALLEKSGLQVAVFDKVRENPTTACVDACLAVARSSAIDVIIGLGGGSSMDTAKGCNFILTNGGRMEDYWGVGKATQPMLPLIAIPTTAGTGSECQSFALIANPESHQKMACGDPKAAARVAILDPQLTISQPRRVTACTGIDAIAHAVETAVTRKRNFLSDMLSREAFKHCAPSLAAVLQNPSDIEGRARMLCGAALAGLAIENSMLGAAHAAANPLTAHFGIVHGQAVGMMLPFVVQFNASDPEAARAYAELASATEIACVSDGLDQAVAALVARLGVLLDAAGMPRSLAECGVKKERIPVMAEESSRQWTASFNPRPITTEDFARLYEQAWKGRGEFNTE